MKKKIIVSFGIILVVIIGILLGNVLHSEKSSGLDGTYLSAKEDICITIKDNHVYIKEEEKDALYNQIYDQIFNENMNKERFEYYVVTAIENLEKGVEYSSRKNILYLWPVPGDDGTIKVHLIEDGVVSLYNVLYERVDD